MSSPGIPFLVLAVVTLVSAGAAMALRSLVHCALALAVAFAGIGALYINLGAPFLGLAQMLVYVGAVAVLIVFVILLTRGAEIGSSLRAAPARLPQTGQAAGPFLALAMFAVLSWAVLHSKAALAHSSPTPPMGVRALGSTMMQGYVFPLEVIGVMLTAALIGAVIIAMKERPESQ